MKVSTEIENVYLIVAGFDDSTQAYTVEFDLMDDTISNVDKWGKIFSEISDGRKLTLKLIWDDDEN